MRSDTDEQGAWGRPVSARVGESIVALVLIATAVFFAWQAVLLPFGRVGLPGPGFFPFALGIVLGLLALAILVGTLQGRIAHAKVVFLGHRDVLIVFAALVGLAAAFEQADSYVVLGGFAAVLLLFIARTTPLRVVLGAVLGMVAVWLFFRLALGVRLPASEFWYDPVGFISSLFTARPS
jgi:Tripartite tricarboxylate transporter TctB family